MRPKSMLLIMIALGCGLVAAFAAFQVVGSQNGQSAVETIKVFVALTEIDIDDPFDSANVKLEEWPRDRVPDGAITELEDLEGKYAAQRLYAGELIITEKVLDPESRNTAALRIPDGYRVCTVKVEVDTALNGLLNPGDRVDVMVFLRKSAEVPVTGIRQLLRDVRVFAVNAETERVYDKEGNKINAKTVSFLVKPEQSAKMLLASQLGVLQLSLRRPDQIDAEEGTGDITLESILNGVADQGDEEEPAAAPLVEESVAVTPEPPAPIDPPKPPKPKFEMEIIYPDTAQRYSWMELGKLPTLMGDEVALPAANPASDSGDSELPDFDDEEKDGEKGASDDTLEEPAE